MPAIGNALDDKLQLRQPVSINGPFPTLLRTADVGDLLQLQISSVPGPGPSPVSVRVFSQHGCVTFVEAVTTGGPCTIPIRVRRSLACWARRTTASS